MVDEEKGLIQLAPSQMAYASQGAVSTAGDFYFPGLQAAAGLTAEKLIVPKEYHQVIRMCYDFYQRGGVVSTVLNRLVELAITELSNGQRNTSDEANAYFDAVLHRAPSRMNRFIRTAALEYFLSGMVLPRIDWEEVEGQDLGPAPLVPTKKYVVPVFDLYPPQLVNVEWVKWGKKGYFIKVPDKDIKLLKSGADSIKGQQNKIRYDMWVQNYPDIINIVTAGGKFVELKEVDAILRKELSISPYPTPFLYNILEPLIFKQQLRRMDFAVASRVVNAIMLVQEGDKDFPITAESRGNLDTIQAQIMGRTNNPLMMERLFMLFSNHTTKITWITPDVTAMLDQDKYRQTNDEIGEGLGFAKILVTGESRNSQASEVSTWAIQPMMEELREMFIEWMAPVYEEAADLNHFRYIPKPTFAPIRLQDFIKTAAVFAQLFKEGNISRSTRDQMAGIDFEGEIELMKDEKTMMAEVGKAPEMPYDITDPRKSPKVAPLAGGPGRPAGAPKGGRPIGSQNVPVNKRNRGVKPKGQQPTSKVAASLIDEDEQLLALMTQFMTENGLIIGEGEDGALEVQRIED